MLGGAETTDARLVTVPRMHCLACCAWGKHPGLDTSVDRGAAQPARLSCSAVLAAGACHDSMAILRQVVLHCKPFMGACMQGGILAIDVAPDNPQLLATAGADGAVHLFDRADERITANLTRHTKRVNGASSLTSPGVCLSMLME